MCCRASLAAPKPRQTSPKMAEMAVSGMFFEHLYTGVNGEGSSDASPQPRATGPPKFSPKVRHSVTSSDSCSVPGGESVNSACKSKHWTGSAYRAGHPHSRYIILQHVDHFDSHRRRRGVVSFRQSAWTLPVATVG